MKSTITFVTDGAKRGAIFQAAQRDVNQACQMSISKNKEDNEERNYHRVRGGVRVPSGGTYASLYPGVGGWSGVVPRW